jgi:hypothetical protein
MKALRILRNAAVGLACLGVVVPQARIFAATSVANAAPTMVDVALAPGGVLVGYVVDGQGVALAGAVVSLRQGEREIARVVTDERGQYTAQKLRGGVYEVAAGQSSRLFRFWAPNTAPPSARPQAVVVAQGDTVRAQGGLVPVVGGIDFITLLILAGVITSTTFSILAYNEAKDDDDDDTPVSP